jgi:hypothetical protein
LDAGGVIPAGISIFDGIDERTVDDKRPEVGRSRTNRPVALLRQKDDDGLDYQLKDRQYLQQEGEMSCVHLNLRWMPAEEFPPAFPFSTGLMKEPLMTCARR